MRDKIIKLLSNYRLIILVYVIFALTSSIQSLKSGTRTYEDGREYNIYNNYTIFEKSFWHLKESKDLYKPYPEEHHDVYKYSPSFAAFFGIFAVFPDWLGLNLWTFLNAFILLISVFYLPKLSNFQKGLILIICLIEFMTSIQNEQSNPLIAGFIILAFGSLEKDKYFLAALCIIFSAYIKLFGLVGFALFLFYPKKWKLVVYSAFWAIIFFVIPLIYISLEQYKELFSSYWNLLSTDYSVSYGYSISGWLNSWFGLEINKLFIVIIGIVIFLIPFYRFKEYKNYTFRFLTLCSILIWVVIFNHKAESPTYIIAMSGVSLWFIISKKSTINIILFVSAFILTSLSPTDIFPSYLHNEFVKPYTLKALPCILIWIKIIWDMIVLKEDKISKEYDT